MDNTERRKQILEQLKQSDKPVSASYLASLYKVSRQIIVGDIALLRASGVEIEATPRGYIIRNNTTDIIRRIAVQHDAVQTTDELYAIVDHGCKVLDVIVSHPIYGELRGSLHLASRLDVNRFIDQIKRPDVRPLSFLTEGIHLHTLSCPSEEAWVHVCDELRHLGILIE